MKTTYPTNTCASFNEWCKYIRQSVNEYKQGQSNNPKNKQNDTEKNNETYSDY